MSNKQPTTINELIQRSMVGIEQGWLQYVVFSYWDCGGEVKITIDRIEEKEDY